MVEKGQERSKLIREIPGIEWPTANFDSNTINFIIEASKNRSLRMLVADQIFKEGKELSQKIMVDFSVPTQEIHNRTIAVREGFMGVGRTILDAESCLMDREGHIQHVVRAVEFINELSDSGHQPDRLRSNMLKDLRFEVKESIKSLNIDPRGFHLLQNVYKRKAIVWEKAFRVNDDPEVIGFGKGIERYKQLYLQTVSAGAKPDTNPLMQKIKARFTIIPY